VNRAQLSDSDRVNILLVGDQPARLRTYEDSLRELGVVIGRAAPGEDAVRRLMEEKVAVVLLDSSMPQMNALATAELIREQPQLEHVRIIVLAGPHLTEHDRVGGYLLGAIDYVDVPFAPSTLRGRVAVLVELEQRCRERDRLAEQLEQANAGLSPSAGTPHDETVGERQALVRALEGARAELARANRTRETEATERLRAEDALRQTEARLSVILESTSVAIGQIDLDNRFVYVNRGFEELFDLVGTDVRGRALHEILRPEIADAFEANCRRVIEDDRPHGFEEISETADRMHAYNAVNSPIRDADGIPRGVACVFTDITERRRLESALRDADVKKDEFLAVLAHELRNPLLPILNAAHVMSLKTLDDPDLRWCSDVIKRQTEHLARLVNDLLDVARITQGKMDLQRERMEIRAAVDRAIEANRPLLDARKQEIVVEIPTPSPKVHGDLTRLSQVIGNLLNNAVKFTPMGGTIRVKVERAASKLSSAGDVVLTVSDTGAGIRKEMLASVFDLFTQADSNAGTHGGLGIGLALVERLVRMHGGSVTAHSEGPDQGSSFVVRLPALRETARATARRRESKPQTAAASRMSVLVVDDNRDSAQSVAVLMRMAGHVVEVAHDGLEAVDVAERFRPDVVLMDIGMPKLDGYGAARRIRSQEWGRKPLLVALTGWGQDDARALTQAAGFDVHMVKPVDFDALSELMSAGPDALAQRVHAGGAGANAP
jgi:PAS domain S-box-containing protein